MVEQGLVGDLDGRRTGGRVAIEREESQVIEPFDQLGVDVRELGAWRPTSRIVRARFAGCYQTREQLAQLLLLSRFELLIHPLGFAGDRADHPVTGLVIVERQGVGRTGVEQ